MKLSVRGWLIVGGEDVGWKMPPEMSVGIGPIMLDPTAEDLRPGSWYLWNGTVPPLTLVLVEVPIV